MLYIYIYIETKPLFTGFTLPRQRSVYSEYTSFIIIIYLNQQAKTDTFALFVKGEGLVNTSKIIY